ncbi:MAG: hypothetical protein ACTSXH_06250 [Promethearchaeota archaeon]
MANFSFTEFEQKIGNKQFYTLLLLLIMLSLFFIQALRSYVPGVYIAMYYVVFGHDVLKNFLILITLIFYLLPALTNTLCKRFGIKKVMTYSIYLTVVSRLFLAFHFPNLNLVQVFLSGFIILFYCIFLSTFLASWMSIDIRIDSNNKFILVVFSIFSAFLIDYLIKTIGETSDLSLLPPGWIADYWYLTQYLWLLIQIPLTVILFYFTKTSFPTILFTFQELKERQHPLTSRYSLIFIGIGAVFFLLFNLFLYPNIISLYTSTDYRVNNILNISVLLITVIIILKVNRSDFMNITFMGVLNACWVIILFLFLFLGTLLTYIASILISISLIFLYLDFYVLLAHISLISFKWEKVKTISNLLAISLAFYVIFMVLHIISTDWAYVLVFLKGADPYIVLFAGIICSITTLISIYLELKGSDTIHE